MTLPTPYYSDEKSGIVIYCGDCREIIPDLAFDAIVADPPYGIGYKTSHSRGKCANITYYKPIKGDNEPFNPSTLLALDVPTVLWGANHYASRLPDSPTWLVWDKRVFDTVNDSADCEMAWSNLGGPARMFRHMWNGMLRDSERGESYHLTQKPVALMLWVLRMLPQDAVILDPYMGAGPVLRAAKDLGMRAIGIEIEESYCATAVRRLAQEVLF